jgi:hypothetical protein
MRHASESDGNNSAKYSQYVDNPDVEPGDDAASSDELWDEFEDAIEYFDVMSISDTHSISDTRERQQEESGAVTRAPAMQDPSQAMPQSRITQRGSTDHRMLLASSLSRRDLSSDPSMTPHITPQALPSSGMGGNSHRTSAIQQSQPTSQRSSSSSRSRTPAPSQTPRSSGSSLSYASSPGTGSSNPDRAQSRPQNSRSAYVRNVAARTAAPKKWYVVFNGHRMGVFSDW